MIFPALFFWAAMPDCSGVAPFAPMESERVSIEVGRFSPGESEPHYETICQSAEPLEIGAFDIRGREESWYRCFYQTERPMLFCDTTFAGRPATLVVRPAVVIRGGEGGVAARDTHAHLFLMSAEGPIQDTFARSLSYDLSKQPLVLDLSHTQGGYPNVEGFSARLRFE